MFIFSFLFSFSSQIFPSENKQWFDNEAADSVDDEKARQSVLPCKINSLTNRFADLHEFFTFCSDSLVFPFT